MRTDLAWHSRLVPVAAAGSALAVVVLVVSLLLPRHWTATAAFRPQAPSIRSSSLAGLAAQFGVALPLDQEEESPDFYTDLLKSRAVLRPLIAATFPVASPTDSASPIAIYSLHEATAARDTEEAVRRLQRDISTSAGLKTGVVTFSVRARTPLLAAALAERLIDQVNQFNLQTRQTRARHERAFTETRVDSARHELRDAEDALTGFLQRNRDYRNAPELQFQHDRLERELTLRQQVYSDLVQSLERSRIEEVRNTPVITVVDPPVVPARPDARHLLLKMVLCVALVVGMWLAWTLIAEPDADADVPRLS